MSEAKSRSDPNVWEKARTMSAILAAVVIPVAVALVGNWYATALKEREIQVRYVELAVSILSQKPTQENSQLRLWAVDVIDFYSAVKLSKDARLELLREQLDISNQRAKEIIEQMGR
jgi:hypothetical protein